MNKAIITSIKVSSQYVYAVVYEYVVIIDVNIIDVFVVVVVVVVVDVVANLGWCTFEMFKVHELNA